MARARATVVAGEEETLMAELLHDFDHVLGHGTKAVIDVIGPGLGQRAVAVAAQIGEYHVIAFRKPRGDAVPRYVIARIAVQEQQGRARTAMPHANDCALRAHVEMLECREQGRDFGATPARGVTAIIGARRLGQHRCLLRR